jgi:predicted nucleic acid-binding protein
MRYLVDANVLSEPTKPAPNTSVIEWLSTHEGDLFVDSIILGELCIGILALPSGRRRARLEQWFEVLAETIECLPWDLAISRRWARLVVDSRRKGRPLPLLDSMIAATALTHGLTVATHNARDFQRVGVDVVDPFASSDPMATARSRPRSHG